MTFAHFLHQVRIRARQITRQTASGRRTIPRWAALVGLLALLLVVLWLARAVTDRGIPISNEQPLRVGHGVPGAGSPPAGGDSANAVSESGSPRAEVPVGFFDFGVVGAHDVVERDFLVVNRGSGVLLIREGYTTCGCTTANLTASRIPPGQAARVTVIFDAGFHNTAGKTVRRGLILETNDPAQPELQIWVQAQVR